MKKSSLYSSMSKSDEKRYRLSLSRYNELIEKEKIYDFIGALTDYDVAHSLLPGSPEAIKRKDDLLRRQTNS